MSVSVRRRVPAPVVLVLAAAALVPPVLTGHARTADAPIVAGVAIGLHVVAASIWVGGLLALAWTVVRARAGDDRAWWSSALPSFSRLALWCVVAVAVSGTVLAFGRLDSPRQLLTSAYGAVIALKAVALGGLVGLGWVQRRYVVARVPSPAAAFVLVAGAELIVMALVFGLAAGLAQTPPPT